jgi:3-hydroxymyristoyl/3-hydroxydecanoyl-(acyl carrier protein) dehydratase
VREPDPTDLLANAAGFFPDSLLMELMAQTAGLLLPEESAGAYVAGIREMHLHRAARGDERVEVQARLNRNLGQIFILECRAEASGTLLAHGSIVLRVV